MAKLHTVLAACLALGIAQMVAGLNSAAPKLIRPHEPQLSWAHCPRLSPQLTTPYAFTTNTLKNNLNWINPPCMMCGPNEAKPCPVLACGFAFAAASSAPRGCAWATSLVTSAGLGTNSFTSTVEYFVKEFTYCKNAPSVEEKVLSVARAATAAGTAVALALVSSSQFVCMGPHLWPSCKTCTTCKISSPQDAISAVSGQATGVGKAVASAVATAISTVYQDDYVAVDANAVAIAVTTAINTATAGYYKRIAAKKPTDCATFATSDCQKAVASAVACVMAKSLIVQSETTATGGVNAIAAQCSDSQALADSSGRSLREMVESCSIRNKNNCGKCKDDEVPLCEGDTVKCFPFGPQTCPDMAAFNKAGYINLAPAPEPNAELIQQQVLRFSSFDNSGILFTPDVIATSADYGQMQCLPANGRKFLYEIQPTQYIKLPAGTTAVYIQFLTECAANITVTAISAGGVNEQDLNVKAKKVEARRACAKCEEYWAGFCYAGPGFFGELQISIDGDCRYMIGDIQVTSDVPAFPPTSLCAQDPYSTGCT